MDKGKKVWMYFHQFFILAILFHLTVDGLAQNDNCINALPISIPNSNFAFGTYVGSLSDLTSATIEPGESFAPAIFLAGQNEKSVWYKFTIPTARSLRVTLSQPGTSISPGDAGFTVYKTPNCLPSLSELSSQLTPLTKFGNSEHPCVDPGDYLVQVSAKNSANGFISVSLILGAPVAAYDNQVQAYDFGILPVGIRTVNYMVDCQTIEDAGEICNSFSSYAQFNKSAWQVFKTPAYFDYIVVFLAHQDISNQKIGYTLYQGDVRTNNYSTLPIVDGCDSLQVNGINTIRKIYKCEDLQSDTYYSLQLFFHQDYDTGSMVKVGIATNGIAATQAPEPILSAIPAPTNSLGILPSSPGGITTSKFDYLGCNSRHSINPCNPSLPANGIIYNNNRYTLSTFFTFTLSSVSDVDISALTVGCGSQLLLRLYKQNVSNICSSLDTGTVISTFLQTNNSLDCLDPGNYTLQVSGRDSALPTNYNYNTLVNSNNPVCILSNLGQRFNLNINVKKKGGQHYSLYTAGAFDSINVASVGTPMLPLLNGITYPSHIDTFACANTVLPYDTTCAPANNKAIYREFVVGDSGILSITNPNINLWYRLYKGDANSLAITQNVHLYPDRINGLIPYSLCLRNNDCNGTKFCVIPDTYTQATFGSNANALANQTSQPSFRFNILNTIFNSLSNAENLGDILSVIPASGGSVQSSMDYFSCKDNAIPINGYQPCLIGGLVSTKAIYRQFYLSSPSIVAISGSHADPVCGTQYGGYMTLFSGKATDGVAALNPLPAPWQCFRTASTPAGTTCNPNLLPAGWYTIISYGVGPGYANPLQNLNHNNDYGSFIGISDQVRITITAPPTSCADPSFNRPYKAAVDNTTGNPFLIQWAPRAGSTPAYPKMDTTYMLYTEHFNCTVNRQLKVD